jgi:hypothetical protein
MATYEITRVRTVQTFGSAHEHIDAVELNGNLNLRFPRSTIIADLKNPYGDRYYTYGGGQYADVVVRGCPYCAFGEYITTLPDTTILNNLLQLPRF